MIDTDGLTDKCSECGTLVSINNYDGDWMVECLECANCSLFQNTKEQAVTEWNKSQRKATNGDK